MGTMEHLLNQSVKQIQISGIRKFSNLVQTYPNAISLTIGQPDFATPEHVKTAANWAIQQNRTKYTHNAGLIELRQAVSQFVKNRYEMSYRPEDEVIVTIGASQGIDIALRTILSPGCEVILPGPVYPGYEPLIRLCGAVPVFVDTRQNGFRLSAERLKEKLTEKTRCVILPYPSNPTGCVLTTEDIQEIADVLRNQELFVLSDEIYSELVYEGVHHSIASIPFMREKTIVINGLSKSHAMTGWRIGFVMAPAYIAQEMLKVNQYSISCASSISQYAALEALVSGIDDPLPMRNEYQLRCDFVYRRLCDIGFDVVKPKGAFYVFPSIKPFGKTSLQFAEELLCTFEIAVVPGSAFSTLGEGYIRISYASSMDMIKEGINRIENYVKTL